MKEECAEPVDDPAVVLQLAFPQNKRPPSRRVELGHGIRVALPIAGHLADPVFPVRFWNPRASPAIVTVPEAAVDEDSLFSPDIGNIGIARYVLAVKPIAGPDRVGDFSHQQFRFGIARAHRPHDCRAVSQALDCRLLLQSLRAPFLEPQPHRPKPTIAGLPDVQDVLLA